MDLAAWHPVAVLVCLASLVNPGFADDSSTTLGGIFEPAPPPPYTTCDATCQQRVKYFEGFIVALVIAMAVGVAFCCMHSIDTPSRFPQPRERAHQE